MSCKLDAGSSNLYSFTGPNVHSTSIYLGLVYVDWRTHCMSLLSYVVFCDLVMFRTYDFGWSFQNIAVAFHLSALCNICHSNFYAFVSTYYYYRTCSICTNFFIFIFFIFLSTAKYINTE